MSTTPELEALRDVCGKLDAAGIEYMLTGSLALSFYARPRMTRDIDMVLAIDAADAQSLAVALGSDYHADAQAMADAFRHRRPCNVIHLPTVVKIDLMPRKPGEYRELEFERRRKVEFAGLDVWICSREDLILSKLDWARESRSEMQLRDVHSLLQVDVEEPYLASWATRLGVESLLEEARDARYGA